ncbi:hypothetical protein ACPC54_38315 [Kitasatospora sp. NPDC094028]
MGIRSFLGFGSSSSNSSSNSSGTSTGTGGMSMGRRAHDEAEALRHHRMTQVPLPEASTDQYGHRVNSPKPSRDHIVRNFGRPYREDGGAR